MPRTRTLFHIVLIFLSVFLLYLAFHYSNQAYWLDFFRGKVELPLKLKIIVYCCQAILVLAAILLLVFRNFIFEKRKEFALMAVSLIICLIILEAGSEIYLCKFAGSETKAKYLMYGQCGVQAKFSPHHYLNFMSTPDYVSPDGLNIHNSLGYRGPEIIMPKPKGVYRIAVTGGSTTYETGVADWHNDFARQLETELKDLYNYSNIEVINAGVPGYSSYESLIDLEFRLIDLHPDMIIIYYGTNDVHTRLTPPEYYKGDNSGIRRQWSPKPLPIFFYLTLIRFMTGINPSNDISYFVKAPTSFELIEGEGYIEGLNRTALETLEANKPVYLERNLKSAVAITNANNISVLLATWAHSDEFDDYASTPHFEYGFSQTNEVIKDIGAEFNLSVYDYALEMPMDKQYWFDGRHVNDAGAKLKGELFANYIYTNHLIDGGMGVLKDVKQ